MTDPELDEKIVDFSMEAINTQSIIARIDDQLKVLAQLPEGFSLSRDGQPGKDRSNGRAAAGYLSRRTLTEQRTGAVERLRILQNNLQAFDEEKSRRAATKEKPVKMAQLRELQRLGKTHVACAAKVQRALDDLHSGLEGLNRSNDELYSLLRKEEHRGPDGMEWNLYHPHRRSERLHFPLALSLHVGMYQRLMPIPNSARTYRDKQLRDRVPGDFEVAERNVTDSMIRVLEKELADITATENGLNFPISPFEEIDETEKEIAS